MSIFLFIKNEWVLVRAEDVMAVEKAYEENFGEKVSPRSKGSKYSIINNVVKAKKKSIKSIIKLISVKAVR